MKSSPKLKKRSSKKYVKPLPAHHSSLDAPIYIWHKIHETSDLSWLLLKRHPVKGQILSRLGVVWQKIYDEYLAEFGFSEAFLEMKRLQISIAELALELALTDDRKLLTEIELLQIEHDEMKKEIIKTNFSQSKVYIEQKAGFQMSVHNTSIREFYSYFKYLS